MERSALSSFQNSHQSYRMSLFGAMCVSMRLSLLSVLLILSLSSVVIAAEPEHEGSPERDWKVLKAQKPAKGSLIPSELIMKIKESFGEDSLEKSFMSAETYFFDSHQLIDPPVKVMTPLGGGTIDLSFLPAGKAKFKIKIKLFDAAGEEVIPDKVYFVPKVSLIEDGKEKNCGEYFDVSSFYKSDLAAETGFETYLTHGIYATSFVGSFVFVKMLPEEKKVLLGNINLIDDRFSKLACKFE